MNIVFWSIVFVLMIIAFVIILPPMWKKRDVKSADSDQRNIDIAQDRVKELKHQLQAGNLTQQQHDEQFLELELNLGDDLDIQQSKHQSSTQGRWVVPVIALSLPLLSVITYYSLGEPEALIKAEIKQTQSAKKHGRDMNTMVMQLAQRLKENPNNAQDWVMLGRSFKYLKQYKLAANSFEKAYQLLGDDPELLLLYADTLVMLNNGTLAGKASELIFKALKKVPNDVTGLWLAGMAKAEEQDYSQAITHWRKIQKIVPQDSEPYAQVQKLIESVQQLSGTTVEDKVVVAKSEAVSKVSIDVKVDISADIKAKVASGDTVFIYAKAITGPPMPLAIVRKQVADLPVSVTLDDSMAMMPGMNLSSFKAVQIIARVSKSGTAMPQKGDYLGRVELTEVITDQTVVIMINDKI